MMTSFATLFAAQVLLLQIIQQEGIRGHQILIENQVRWQIQQGGGLVHHARTMYAPPTGLPTARILAECRIPADTEGMTTYLQHICNSRAQLTAATTTEQLIEQLGHTAFDKRREASHMLAELMPLPLNALLEAATGPDPEVSVRARDILCQSRLPSGSDPTPLPQVLDAISRTIRMKGLIGLGPLLLDTLPEAGSRHVEESIYDAMQATATTNDAARLKAALFDQRPALREAAIRGMMAVITEETTAQLREVVQNEPDPLRILAVRALINRADRNALGDLVTGLTSEQVAVRHDAADTLRLLTEQAFGYNASEPPDTQRDAIQAWRDWVDTRGKRAPLRFPVELGKHRFDRFRKRVAALCSVRMGTVRARVQVDGEDVVGGASGFDPGRGVVVVAYLHGAMVLRESFPSQAPPGKPGHPLAQAIEALPTGTMVTLVASGEAAPGFDRGAMLALCAIGGQTRVDGFHAHGTYICVGCKGLLPGQAMEMIDPSGGPLIYRGTPKGVLFRKEKGDDL